MSQQRRRQKVREDERKDRDARRAGTMNSEQLWDRSGVEYQRVTVLDSEAVLGLLARADVTVAVSGFPLTWPSPIERLRWEERIRLDLEEATCHGTLWHSPTESRDLLLLEEGCG